MYNSSTDGFYLGLALGIAIGIVLTMVGLTLFSRYAIPNMDKGPEHDADWWKKGLPPPC